MCARAHVIGYDVSSVKGRIEELGLPLRVENHLKYEGVRTIAALLKKTPYDLLQWRNFGIQSVKAVRKCLEARGLSLKDDPGIQAIWEWDQQRIANRG